MYAVQAFIGDYFKKGFIIYNEAVAHADKKCAEEGQPFQVVEMKLMYQVTPTKLKKTG